MAGATLTTIDAILKEYYLPPVIEQFNNEVLLLSRIEQDAESLVGRLAVVPVHLQRSGGIGPARELGNLPAAGNQGFAKATFDLKFLYGRGQVSGPSVSKSASDAGAFLRVLKAEIDFLRNDLKRDVARMVYGNDDGVVSTAASLAGQVITLQSDEALRHGWLYVNMVVDVYQGSTSTIRQAGLVISAVTLATPSITVVGTTTGIVNNDQIVRAGSRDATGHIGIAGLDAVISTSTFGNLNPATAGNEEWQSIVDSAGGALSVDKMLKVYNQTRVKAGEGPKALYTTFGLQRTFFNLLQAQVNYVEPMKIEGGFRYVAFNDLPLIGDVDAPFGKIFFPDESAIKLFSNMDWKFLDEDGHALKWVIGKDAWEFALARYMQIGVNRRNSSAKMTGLTDVGF
jgi:hypothetical protein